MDFQNLNLSSVLEQVGKEKNIDRTVLISALEAAMLSAARKKLGPHADLEARFNDEAGEVEVYEFKQIVAEVHNPTNEISFEDAKKLDPDLSDESIGEDLGIKLDSKEFGRIAAQNAKQIIVQRMREAERTQVHDEYKDRKDELVTGIVRRFERGNMVVDLGRAEGVVPMREQVNKENVRIGDRVVAYVVDVLEIARGAQIVLSRTHPNLVVRLFEQEVPEIAEGTVTIEGVAREAGFRTKIAVRSKDSDVDPVGACVGMKGARVQAVVQELRGEKIDIVPWEQDEARFVCNSLAPAEVSRVLVRESDHSMLIVVPDDQLSLAIGRRGQNVRLAAELTGWKIDIHSETKVNEERDAAWARMSKIEGLGEFQIQTLYNHGFRNVQDILNANLEMLQSLPGLEGEASDRLVTNAKVALEKEIVLGQEAKKASREEARQLTKMWDAVEKDAAEFALDTLPGIDEEKKTHLSEHGFDDLLDVSFDTDAKHLIAAGFAEADAKAALEFARKKLG